MATKTITIDRDNVIAQINSDIEDLSNSIDDISDSVDSAQTAAESAETSAASALTAATAATQAVDEAVSGKADTTVTDGLQTQVTQNADDIALKADQADLDSLSDTVDTNAASIQLRATKTELQTLSDTVDTKADQTDLDTANTAISDNSDAIDSANAAIQLRATKTELQTLSDTVDTKADQTSLDTTNSAVSDNADAISQNAADIQARALQTALDATNTTVATKAEQTDLDSAVSDIEQNATDIALKADQTDLDSTNTTVATKADQADLDSLEDRVAQNETDIAAIPSDVTDLAQTVADNTTAIATKADQTDLDTLSDTVGTKADQTDLDTLSNTVTTKADQTDLDSLGVSVAKNESSINDIESVQTIYDSWGSLSGSLNKGSIVNHNDVDWLLLVDLEDVTSSEPSYRNSDYKDLLNEKKSIAIANNTSLDNVAFLYDGAVLSGEEYLHVVSNQITYYAKGGATGTISSVGADTNKVITITYSDTSTQDVVQNSKGTIFFALRRTDLTDAQNINGIAEWLSTNGGGTIKYCFNPVISESLILYSNVMHDLCNHTVTQSDGVNVDIYKTYNFDSLTGTGPYTDAPKRFGVVNGIIDGNYLDGDWNDSDTTIVNSAGSGIKAFGSLFKIDVEINNCAEHLLWTEGTGSATPDDTYASIRVHGRVCGQEGFIFRGPGDCKIEGAWMGLAGILPISSAATTLPTSTLYAGTSDEQIHCMVIDGDNGDANVEVGTMHLYAAYNGRGLKTIGTCRLEYEHIITESCNGGIWVSSGTYGDGAIISVRNNNRYHPNLDTETVTPPTAKSMFLNESTVGFNCSCAKLFRSVAGTNVTDGGVAMHISGSENHINMHHRNSTNTNTSELYTGNALTIEGDNNYVTGVISRPNGKGINLSGHNNVINMSIKGGINDAAFYRDSDTQASWGNNVTLAISDCETAIHSVGTPASEIWNITLHLESGQTAFTGDRSDVFNNQQIWNISGVIGTTRTGNHGRYSASIDDTSADVQTVTFTHLFPYTPRRHEISLNVYDPSEAGAFAIYPRVQSISSTEIVVFYQFETAASTSSGALLTMKID